MRVLAAFAVVALANLAWLVLLIAVAVFTLRALGVL